MPPGFVHGQDVSSWPAPDGAEEYHRHLLSSTLARVGGRNYVLQLWHKATPKNCPIIDGLVNPNVDIIVNVAPIGKCTRQKSMVRIRYILLPIQQDSLCEGKSKQPLLVEDLRIITLHSTLVRKHVCKDTDRANGGDFGDMHAMGTYVPHDDEGLQVVGYFTHSKVPHTCCNTWYRSRHRSQSCVINGRDGKYAMSWLHN